MHFKDAKTTYVREEVRMMKLMKLIKRTRKDSVGTVKSFGSNGRGCGDSYGNGPNQGGAAGNYTNNK